MWKFIANKVYKYLPKEQSPNYESIARHIQTIIRQGEYESLNRMIQEIEKRLFENPPILSNTGRELECEPTLKENPVYPKSKLNVDPISNEEAALRLWKYNEKATPYCHRCNRLKGEVKRCVESKRACIYNCNHFPCLHTDRSWDETFPANGTLTKDTTPLYNGVPLKSFKQTAMSIIKNITRSRDMTNIKKNMINIKKSKDVYSSRSVDSSSDVYLSRSVDSSSYVDSSRFVYLSRYVDLSRYVIFCYDIKLKEYYAFNKQVTESRYNEIKNYWNEIKGDFKLELKDNEWEDEWKKLPNEVWKKLSELPEFDKEVVEKIIGFELNLEVVNEVIEITLEEIAKMKGIPLDKLRIKE